MKETLKTLAEYQIEAFEKGVDFNFDYSCSAMYGPRAEVKLEYTSTKDDTNQLYVFSTTFSKSMKEDKVKERLDNIKYFIDNIVVNKK